MSETSMACTCLSLGFWPRSIQSRLAGNVRARIGGDRLLAGFEALAGGDDDGNFGQQSLGLADVGVVGVVGDFGFPVGEQADGRAEHVHRRSVVAGMWRSASMISGGTAGGGAEALTELGGLLGRRQFAVENQIGDFFIAGVLGEVFDRVAAIGEAGLDRADRRFAGDDAFQAG